MNCPYCNKQYNRKGDLTSHLFKKHIDKAIKTFVKCKNKNCNNKISYYTINGIARLKDVKQYCSKKCSKEVLSLTTIEKIKKD